MRLITYRATDGTARLALAADGVAIAATELWPQGPDSIAALLAGGPETWDRLASAVDADRIAGDGSPLAELDLLAPVPHPGKIVAVGRNYRSHAAEEGAETPPAPLLFAKWPSSVVGHASEIRWDPALTSQVDWEAELAVVIGRRTRHVTVEEAPAAVFGYTCLNDVSARDVQFGDGQWTRGKSLDTFCPMGPVLVTADELPNADDLELRCLVNGEEVQCDRTSSMYYGIAEIISYCSRSFTLEPGDVIATGTPAGVGAFQTPPRFLADGDEVVVEIEGIGRLVNVCRTEASA